MDVSCRKVDKILHKEGESFTCTLSLLQILHVPCIKKGFVFTAFEEPVFLMGCTAFYHFVVSSGKSNIFYPR